MGAERGGNPAEQLDDPEERSRCTEQTQRSLFGQHALAVAHAEPINGRDEQSDEMKGFSLELGECAHRSRFGHAQRADDAQHVLQGRDERGAVQAWSVSGERMLSWQSLDAIWRQWRLLQCLHLHRTALLHTKLNPTNQHKLPAPSSAKKMTMRCEWMKESRSAGRSAEAADASMPTAPPTPTALMAKQRQEEGRRM